MSMLLLLIVIKMKNQICQLCYCDDDNAIASSNSNLINLIYKHLHITIQDIHNVCIQCEQIIIHWDQFAQKCWTTQTILQESHNIKLESESAEIKEENLSDFSYEDKDEDDDKHSVLEYDLKFEDPLSKHENNSSNPETNHQNNDLVPKKRKCSNSKTKSFNCVEIICHICSVTMKNWSVLKSHCLKEHSTKPKVLCLCGKYLTTEGTIFRHKILHNEGKGVKCENCDKKFVNMKFLNEHILSAHTSKDEYAYSCDQCPKKFHSAKLLNIHTSKHLPPDLKPKYPCDVCGAVLATKYALKVHKEARHENLKIYICDECGKRFATKGNLKEHKYSHTDQKDFKCDKCDSRFKSKSLLKSHEDIHSETGYKCPQCPVVLKSRRGLRKHLDVHNPNLKYSCTLCDKKFRRSHHLKEHVNSHYDIKLYKCDLCSKSFTNNQNLKLHKKSKHSSEIM